MDIERIYEQPFNEITTSPEDLFNGKESDLDKICSLIQLIKERSKAIQGFNFEKRFNQI